MYIIGITGGTASGKTTFVKQLKDSFNSECLNIISQDDYYKPLYGLTFDEKDKFNFDHPDALDFNLLEKHLLALKKGELIGKPTYDFNTHDRLFENISIVPKPILILEGILILSVPKVKILCDYTIFIDAPEDIRQKRRLKRDLTERGRTAESVLNQFEKNIHPMHRQFIEPLKKGADFIIDGTKDFTEPLNAIASLIQKQVSLP